LPLVRVMLTLFSIILFFTLIVECVSLSAPTPPLISPVSVSTVNVSFSTGGMFPGHLWYDLPNNKVNQQWQVSPTDLHSQVQLDWNNGSIAGVLLFIDVNPKTNHTTCGVIELFEGPYSVDMWDWVQNVGQYNGTAKINGVNCDYWWARPDSMQFFQLYVKQGTNVPVRFINEGGGNVITLDFITYQPITPPSAVFNIPSACKINHAEKLVQKKLQS